MEKVWLDRYHLVEGVDYVVVIVVVVGELHLDEEEVDEVLWIALNES